MATKPTYVNMLNAAEKGRYLEKLKLIGGVDPYSILSKEWSLDVGLLPDISYPDIVNYLVFSPSPYTMNDLKAFKGLEAYNFFVSGWVRQPAAIILNGYHVVTARVMHSQRLSEKPLAPWLIAEKCGKVVAVHCDCMAGLGETCSHAAALMFYVDAALMFYVDAAVRIRNSRTVTQEKAYWMLPTTMKSVEYSQIADINFQSSNSKRQQLNCQIDNLDSLSCRRPTRPPRVKRTTSSTPSPSSENIASFYHDLSKCNIKPAILSLIPPYSDHYTPKPVLPNFPSLLTDLHNIECCSMKFNDLLTYCANVKIVVGEEEAKNVEEATRDQADSNLWFLYRAGRITASRFKSACHTDPGLPSQSLIKAICYPEANRFFSAATTWGCNHEKVAREHYLRVMTETHTDFSISISGFVINKTYPFIGATPDGIISCKCCGNGCLEIKCPYCMKNETLTDDNSKLLWLKANGQGQLQLNKTHMYYYQVQCQLNSCLLDFADFVVWTENDIHIERVEKDRAFFDEKIKRASEFFKLCILPELVGKFYSRPPVTNVVKNDEHVEESGKVMWCYCKKDVDDTMIGCDLETCNVQWFHFKCVGLKMEPKGKWYCPDCRKIKKCGKDSNKTKIRQSEL